MLRRAPFKRARFEPAPRAPLQPVRGARKATMASKHREIKPVLKENPLEYEPYRRLICTLPCMRCGIHGFTQAAHADCGKGLSLKTDDRTCWPGCGPHHGLPGCHHYVGTTGALGKMRRREVEAEYAAKAIALLRIQALTDRRVAKVLRAVGLLA